MTVRLGQVLITRGLLTTVQLDQLLAVQAERNRPIGLLAEELFDLDPTEVERAWAEQYASITTTIDLAAQPVEPQALATIERRQAWQFAILPVRFDGCELVVATTKDNLPRALRFVSRCLTVPCYLVLAEPEALGEALARHYPMGGLSADAVIEGTQLPAALLDA